MSKRVDQQSVNADQTFILFHTEACHLCEQAQALLDSLSVAYTREDICDSDTFVERYGIRIPVLLRQQDQLELDWPFDIAQLKEFTGA
ncbi:glutaredoxin family protein [Shewanella sp. AS1]|uniref:glutaredoxin family protein n=1 Tax=Shewanella sp. AS1 TaxID=2907626 RepID=UPI001F3B6082|nr:glutaredoxin family protein [Shewanella sp. AS1]MCE9678852.1 glutaredoxin family protein [Shewanella sp. AS1]